MAKHGNELVKRVQSLASLPEKHIDKNHPAFKYTQVILNKLDNARISEVQKTNNAYKQQKRYGLSINMPFTPKTGSISRFFVVL